MATGRHKLWWTPATIRSARGKKTNNNNTMCSK
jgi:hypothetical protein